MTKTHIHIVDALRGFAIILIVLYHSLNVFYPNYAIDEYSKDGILMLKDTKSFILNFNPIALGWIGVELFLVISGFLIHYAYLQNQKQFTWLHFYKKRFWRIYPTYFIVLVFFFIHRPDFSTHGLFNFFSHLFFFHNLSESAFFAINPSFWSIALEAQIYLLYPIFLYLVKKIGIEKTTILFAILHFLNCFFVFWFGIISFVVYASLLNLLFVWVVGAFLADRYYHNRKILKNPLLWCIIFYLLCYVCKVFYFTKFFMFVPATFACLALMEVGLYHNFEKYSIQKILIQFLSFTGLMSYSIYLIHQPYLADLISFYNPNAYSIFWNNLIRAIFTYLTIYAISYFCYQFIEVKSIEFGKKLKK